MPLRDHFHPPLNDQRHWTSFHHTWAVGIATELNRHLPPGYYAEPHVQFRVEIDVATLKEAEGEEATEASGAPWQATAPALTLPFTTYEGKAEILVFDGDAGRVLAAAIELVSPGNKDRLAQRSAFTTKCASILYQEAGLIVVDIVTERQANLHNDLLAHFYGPEAPQFDADLYAASYRPSRREKEICLEVWQESLAVGASLPTLPLWVHGFGAIGVDLNSTYEVACRGLRISGNGS
jgi:hypothetical protein